MPARERESESSRARISRQVGLDKLLRRGPTGVPSAMGVVVGDLNSRVFDGWNDVKGVSLLPDSGGSIGRCLGSDCALCLLVGGVVLGRWWQGGRNRGTLGTLYLGLILKKLDL